MDFLEYRTLLLELNQGVLHILLNRPESRNSMNLDMVKDLRSIFNEIREDRKIRAVVLRGSQGNFCSGGDIKEMSNLMTPSIDAQDNKIVEYNREFGRMLTQINTSPQAVITVLEGVALGGGFGLCCVSDVAISQKDCIYGLPETGLGIPPAQIAPFVVERIGITQARRLGVLGVRFDGSAAKELGLVHSLFDDVEEMQKQLEKTLKQIRRNAPQAIAITKKLMLNVGKVEIENLLNEAAYNFSECIQGGEGKEGTRAFIEKRDPNWMEN